MRFKTFVFLVASMLLTSCTSNNVPAGCNHKDENKDHNCDICEIKFSEHLDDDNNHKCDICDYVMSTCLDNDKNHKCDICQASMGAHEDTNNDHLCEYCGNKASEHEDNNYDHNCDICGEKYTDHIDKDKDDECDICGLNMNFKIYATYKSSSYNNASGVQLVSDPYENPEQYSCTINIEEGDQVLIQDNLKVAYKSYVTDNNVETDAFANSVATINTANNHLLFHAYGSVTITYDSSKSENNIYVKIKAITCYQTCESISSSSMYYKAVNFVPSVNKPNVLTYSLGTTTYKFTNGQSFQIRANNNSKTGLKHFTLGPNTNTQYFELEELTKSTCLTYKGKDTYTFFVTVTVEIATYKVVVDIAKT